jgi:hypothetical protein
MTSKDKADVLFTILTLAPMAESRDRFRRLADAGDVAGFWKYYETCLKNPSRDQQIEQQGLVSFRMLRPALQAIYDLPSK